MTKTECVLCISDLHLSRDRPDLAKAFRYFVENTASSAHSLFILGDFFNLWIGDDNPDDFAIQISTALRSLSDTGTAVFIMHGNRDFLIGKDFSDTCGATLVNAPYTLDCFGSQYLLMHGDSLCTRDVDYMAFRAMVRNPSWQQEFLSKPLAERQAIAQDIRTKSKSMSSNKADDIMDVTPSEVDAVLELHDQQVLIHGHTHRPGIHEIKSGGKQKKRIVLGDWDKSGWYLEIVPGGFDLKEFRIQG